MKKYPIHLANNFDSIDSLKTRIRMLYAHKYTRYQLLRLALLAPLLLAGIFILAFNQPNNLVVSPENLATKQNKRTTLNGDQTLPESSSRQPNEQPVSIIENKSVYISEWVTKDSSGKIIKTTLPLIERVPNLITFHTTLKNQRKINHSKEFIMLAGANYVIQAIDAKTKKPINQVDFRLTQAKSGYVAAAGRANGFPHHCYSTAKYTLSSTYSGKLPAEYLIVAKRIFK